jgi:DNA-binding NarL/FixJ family response regulator
MITVLIADDQAIVRDVFRFLLERAGDIEIVGMAANGKEALEQAALYSPDIVVMDVSMPVMDGIEATRRIRVNHPETRVVVISMYDNAHYVVRSLQAGAQGYVLKETAGDELLTAIRSVHHDIRYFSKKIAELAQRFFFDTGKPDAPPSVASGL